MLSYSSPEFFKSSKKKISKNFLNPGFLTTYVHGFSFDYKNDNHGGQYKTWKSMGHFWAKFYEYPGPKDKGRCYEVITKYNHNLGNAHRFLVGKLTFERYSSIEEFMPNYGRFYVVLREDLEAEKL